MTSVETYSGNNTSVLMQFESGGGSGTYGTDVGSWSSNGLPMGMLLSTLNLTARNNLKRQFAIGGQFAQQIPSTILEQTGTATGAFQVGRLIAYWMGDGSDTKAGAGPYTHTMSPTTSLDSFELLVSRGVTSQWVETITGCAMQSIRFSSSVNDPLTMDCNFVAQKTSANTTGATAAIINADTVQVPQFGTLYDPNSTALAQVTNFDLTMTNTLPDINVISSRFRQGIPCTNRTMDLNMTVLFNSTDAVQLFKDYTNTSSAPYVASATADLADQTFKIIYTNAAATTSLRKIQFNLKQLRYEEMTENTRVGELTTMQMTAQIGQFDTNPIVTTDNYSTAYPN